ncbi:FAD-binding oxidoreductase [Mycobacteroides abscessus]|uniref:FAD-binding oxidoreductase n=1 Tax=Mycobacteroides abscessus TaxID=36809 RepID=UPI000C25F8D7
MTPEMRTDSSAVSVQDVVEMLRQALGEAVTHDENSMLGYRRDQSFLTDAGRPIALVRARTVDDVVLTLKIANSHGTPVVTRGAGTGLAGAANAVEGCILLSTERMNTILKIDTQARTATVQPGVLNADLAAAAKAVGLWYVPDPGSRAISSIGGNLATNAGGPCCTKYGVTADHVARIKAVLSDGRVVHTGADTRKNVAGLNLTQLLVGSEGTLAVIVEATMRLRVASTAASTVVANFAKTSEAIAAVLSITESAEPCLVELMDSTTVSAVNDMTRMGLEHSEGSALLLVQCDGRDAAAEAATSAAACARSGATEVYRTDDPAEGEDFMQARRVALTALERRGRTLLDDVAVPVPRLPEMLAAIESTSRRHGVLIGTFGHAADGNLHPTIVFDAANSGEVARAKQAFDDIVSACLSLGGSISGEHGIGVLKHSYLETMVGSTERELMLGIKRAFDPAGILNPGRGI